MLEGALDCVITIDREGRVLEFNPAAERTFGYQRDEAIGRPLSELIVPPAKRPVYLAGLERLARERTRSIVGQRVELTAMRKDGSEFPAEASITCVECEGDLLFTGFIRDISERAANERELREARDRAERYLNMAGSIIVALDRQCRVTMINRAGLELLGFERQELVDADWVETAVPPEAREDARHILFSMLRGVAPRDIGADRAEAPIMTKSGERRTIEWRTVVLRGDDGVPSALLCSGTDVTERIRSEQAVTHLAYHDQLTGLPNRALLEEHLEIALARAERDGRELALLFLDLDNFKLVNDSLGHAAGDRLLKLVAERLTTITRASDLLARHGGDEFLLLLTDLDGGTTVEVAEAVGEKILKSLEEPFHVGGASFDIGASVGIAVFPQDGRSSAALLRTADATMYQAKAAGRNRIALHRRGLGIEEADRLISATTRLRRAFTMGQLVVHYQPILTVPEGSVAAVEALVRWDDPRRGLVPAADFIQLAEETGLIESIGEWVIGAVCSQAAAWRDAGTPTCIHFNLSPRQLRQRHLIESIRDAVSVARLEPGTLTAEISEHAALTEARGDSSMLEKLHGLGFHLAIDDFGAGNSSLGRLRELPVDELKLHRLLLRGVPHDRNASALARAVIDLAGGLGMRALAEGVETEDQWRFLVEHGCPLAQGYHLGRPGPAEEIERLLRTG
jgi:diguanylate cyclase (GGDEF)-like protein/PAS domain S-box-containing protein